MRVNKLISWLIAYIFIVAINLVPVDAMGWGVLPAISGTPTTFCNCVDDVNNLDAILLIHSNTNDGSVTFVDSSGGTNSPHSPFTVSNDTHHSKDQRYFGSTSIYFDGTGDSLSLPDHTDWDITNSDFGIGFWVRLDSTGSWYYVIGNGSGYISGSHAIGWGVTIQGGAPGYVAYFETDGGSMTYEYRVAPTINAGTWYHIEVNRVAPSPSVAIYVDGTVEAVNGETGGQAVRLSTDALTLGKEPSNASGYLAGYIDEIIVKTGVYLHNGNFTVPSCGYCD